MEHQAYLWLWPVLGSFVSLLCLYFSLRAARRRRFVADVPTSKTTGVFIGLVELKGTAEAEEPLASFLAGTPCICYTWSVEEHWSRTVTETYTDSQGRTQTRTRHESGWKTVANGGEEIPFYLQDDCGVIRIQPAHAKIEPATVFDTTCGRSDALYYGKGPTCAVADSDHRRHFVERAVPLHGTIYVMGQARERKDVVAAEIAHDGKELMFLISTRTEEQVSSGLHGTFWLVGLLGLMLCVAGFVGRDVAIQCDPQSFNATYLFEGSGFLFVWFVGWFWMVYNSMIDLRQRVRQAWANVDVQLKRRYDLIPNLVRAVEGMRDHEQKLQTELARLRTQLQATPPGEPGPDHQACSVTMTTVVERYPELRANESFLNLQKNLVDTEQRIALARSYFNDIAMFYNTRFQTIPDRYIAALGTMKPQVLMAANDFERAPLRVNLAT
ncbi:MAG: LemA domain-containing protein [Verrucomicrobiae bacterium]|nr:LemA domain-containing protein [Verrucomicrobiae bacterium]